VVKKEIISEARFLSNGCEYTGEYYNVQYRIFLKWGEDWSVDLVLTDYQTVGDGSEDYNPWLFDAFQELSLERMNDIFYTTLKKTPEYKNFQKRIDFLKTQSHNNPNVDLWLDEALND
jgi:hypothetical protein